LKLGAEGASGVEAPKAPRRVGRGDDDDEGRINFSVALSSKTTRTRNNKLKQ